MRHAPIVGLCAVLLPAAALAQAEPASDRYGPAAGQHEFTLSGTGTTDNDFERGLFGVTAGYGWYVTPELQLSLRQSLGWSDSGASSWNGSTRIALDYHFDFGRFRPFVGVNLGGVYGDDVKDTGIVSPEVGLKYYANSTTFLYGMAEYQVFFESGDDIEDNFDDSAFVYTVGIGFNF